MSGNRKYILDTNAIISLLKGDKNTVNNCKNSDYIGISIISQIEYMVFPDLNNNDKELFNIFSERVDIIDLESDNIELLEKIYSIRKNSNLKLPDAIIAASAIIKNATLLTADKDFLNIKNLKIKII